MTTETKPPFMTGKYFRQFLDEVKKAVVPKGARL